MELLEEWDRVMDNASEFFPRPDLTRLRMRLIKEEYEEVLAELVKFIENPVKGDRPALAKELADLLYVIYGTGTALELDLDYALQAVHASNMTKLVNGEPVKDAGGKTLKGPNYRPPDLSVFAPSEGTTDD